MTDVPRTIAAISAEAASTTYRPASHSAPPAVPEINSSLRIPALDGLRGIAILLVLLWHSIFAIVFVHHPVLNRLLSVGRLSWSGVDLFFVLSGFLIGGILLDNRESSRYFKTFYFRRAYRILPLYFLILTLCWLTFHLSSHGWNSVGRVDIFPGEVPWWSFFTFTQNLAVAVTGGASRGGLGVTWSLAIEEQFYLTLPLVIRRLSRRNLVYLLGAIICGAPLLRALLIIYRPDGAVSAYVLTPCRADALAIGVLCAVLVRTQALWRDLTANRAWIYAALGSLGLFLAVIIAKQYPFYNKALYGLEFSVLAFFYAALLLVAVTGTDKFVSKVLCNRLLMKLGVLAYGTYLLHHMSMEFLRFLVTRHNAQPSAIALLGADVLGIALAIGIASASWRWFEKPMVRRGHAQPY